MRNYITNLRLWYHGWHRFHEITDWKPGYGPDSKWWKVIYGFDYLAGCLIFGGEVVSVSYMLGRYWGFTAPHFANAGRPLWGSVRSSPWVRITVPIFWLIVIWWLI